MGASVENIETESWNKMRRGDVDSLSWIYDRYFKLLYNYGKKLNRDDRSVEDAIHDLFVDLWNSRQNLSPTTSVRFYLYRALRRRLARNHSDKDIFRERSLEEDDLFQIEKCIEEQIVQEETLNLWIDHLKKMLNDLSPRQYEAMVLRFYDDFSFDEIGAILGVNEQSARNLVQRGLAQLRQYSKLLPALLLLILR